MFIGVPIAGTTELEPATSADKIAARWGRVDLAVAASGYRDSSRTSLETNIDAIDSRTSETVVC